MRVKGMALAVGLAIGGVLTGCNAEQLDDGYQFGDVTSMAVDVVSKASTLRDSYCDRGNEGAKALLLTAVKVYMPAYPPDGICTDSLFVDALATAVTAKGAGPPADPM